MCASGQPAIVEFKFRAASIWQSAVHDATGVAGCKRGVPAGGTAVSDEPANSAADAADTVTFRATAAGREPTAAAASCESELDLSVSGCRR